MKVAFTFIQPEIPVIIVSIESLYETYSAASSSSDRSMESCKPTDQTNVKLIKGDLLHVTHLAKSRNPSTGPDLNVVIKLYA